MVEYAADVHFWRQHFILFSILIGNLGTGCMLAFPSVLNPSIQAPNGTDIRATDAEATWIASSTALSAIPAFIILPILMQRFGRRLINIVGNFFMLCGWIIFLLAKDITSLFIARILHGFTLGCAIINVVLVAEYANPKRRGYFIVSKKLFIALGSSLCHFLFLFFSWRHISAINIIFNLISIIFTFFWPESPAFLVTRNRFDDCEKSYIWLHGNNSNKKELLDMISSQEGKLKDQGKKNTVKYIVKRLLQKDSLKAFIITIFLVALVEASGKHYFAAYLIQMMTDLLGDKSLAVYVTLGGDLTSIIGLCITVIIVRHIKRRTLLFGFGYLSVLLLFILSICLFFKSSHPSVSLDWLSICLILIFTLITNIGMIPVAFTAMGEVFPLDLKGIGVAISGVAFSTILAVYLKIIPFLISRTGLSGTYFINAIIAGISLFILRYILPETKDRTLLDIENEMKGKKSIDTEGKPML